MTKPVFNTNASEYYSNGDGDVFEFNNERAEYLSYDIYKTYTERLEKHAKKFKKSKKEATKEKHAGNLLALRDEWTLGDDDTPAETLYCVWAANNEDTWTDLTTDNQFYS